MGLVDLSAMITGTTATFKIPVATGRISGTEGMVAVNHGGGNPFMQFGNGTQDVTVAVAAVGGNASTTCTNQVVNQIGSQRQGLSRVLPARIQRLPSIQRE